MSETFNIYCDESCHLENDNYGLMVLGAVWCPARKVKEITRRVREIKAKHGLPHTFEMKWTKVSASKIAFYLDILDYFFDDDDLHFRVLVAKDKSNLRHEDYQQNHDDWYYKMYFSMLKTILDPLAIYHIYLDIKDTHSGKKQQGLLRILRNHVSDYDSCIVRRLQSIRSYESEIIQIVDLLIGAVGYVNRGLEGNAGKTEFIARFRGRSRRKLTETTLLRELKTNVFIWHPAEEANLDG